MIRELALTLSDGTLIDHTAPIDVEQITTVATYYLPDLHPLGHYEYQNKSAIFDAAPRAGVAGYLEWYHEYVLASGQKQILFYFDAGTAVNVVSGEYKTSWITGSTLFTDATNQAYTIGNARIYGADSVPDTPSDPSTWTLLTANVMTEGVHYDSVPPKSTKVPPVLEPAGTENIFRIKNS
jgi:hypothetical protein